MFLPEQEVAGEDFVPVDRKDTSRVKKNAVFTVIEELIAENHDLIRKSHFTFQRIEPEGKKAYLFNIPTAPENVLFQEQGFVFQERHLRVDQFYSLETETRGSTGLTAAHYTESYVIPNTSQKLTIHVFFGNREQYVQIKRTDEKQSERMEVGSDIVQLATLNGFSALDFYDALGRETYKRHLNALKIVDQFEVKLTGLSVDLNSKGNIKRYLEALDEFVKLVKRVNDYNELQEDTRWRIQKGSREFMLQRLASMEDAVVVESAAAASTSIEDVASSAERKEAIRLRHKDKADREQKAQHALLDVLRRFSQLLAPYIGQKDAASLMKTKEIEKQFHETLLVHPFELNEAHLERTKQLQLQFDKLPSVASVALEAALQGDSKWVDCLLPYLSFSDQEQMVVKILHTLESSELNDSSVQAEGLRSVCKLLYQKSPYYEMILKRQAMLFRILEDEKIGVSLLCLLGIHHKKHTFEMLLSQGVDPNGLGYMHGNVLFNQLKSALMIFGDPYYAISLLKHGAIVDAPKSQFGFADPDSRRIKLNLAQFSRGRSSEVTNNEIANSFDLVIACRFSRFELIAFLLERSCWQSKILALSEVSNVPHVITRQVPYSQQSGVFVASSLAEADQLSMTLLSEILVHIRLAFILFTKIKEFEVNMPSIGKLADAVNALCQKNPSKIDGYLRELETLTQGMERKQIGHTVCKLLLCEKPELELMDSQRLIQAFCHMGKLFSDQNVALMQYQTAVNLALHSEPLRTTPLYQFALRKKKELEGSVAKAASTSGILKYDNK